MMSNALSEEQKNLEVKTSDVCCVYSTKWKFSLFHILHFWISFHTSQQREELLHAVLLAADKYLMQPLARDR